MSQRMRETGFMVGCVEPARSVGEVLAVYLNLLAETAAPASKDSGVIVNMAGSTEPSDFQRLIIIFMVAICSGISATLTWHPFGMGFPGSGSCKTFFSVLRIAVISVSLSLLNSLGVTCVERFFVSLNPSRPWLPKITTAPRTETTCSFARLEVVSAVFASVKFHVESMAFARQKSKNNS